MKNNFDKGYIGYETIISIGVLAFFMLFVYFLFSSIAPHNKKIENKDVQNALNLCNNGVSSLDIDSYGGPRVLCK